MILGVPGCVEPLASTKHIMIFVRVRWKQEDSCIVAWYLLFGMRPRPYPPEYGDWVPQSPPLYVPTNGYESVG